MSWLALRTNSTLARRRENSECNRAPGLRAHNPLRITVEVGEAVAAVVAVVAVGAAVVVGVAGVEVGSAVVEAEVAVGSDDDKLRSRFLYL